MSAEATTLPRLLAGADPRGGAPLATHLAHHGLDALAAVDPARLVEEVERAGLRGRGGAAFPSATKLAVVGRGPRRPVVVANGSEGEPASMKDATLLAQVPHLVLDGVQLAAAATGADTAFVCVKARADAAHAALATALAERAAAARDAVPVTVVAVPDGYVSGEESALVHLLDGGPALPTAVPPRPFERGVGGRPTLIQNVETLAHVALIARHGADWHRAIGTPEEPGSALVTLCGAVARPGVREIALGTSVASLVEHGGGDLARSRAVLLGGWFGTWLDPHAAQQARLDGASLRPSGASLGCGVVAVLGADACPVAETARIVRWLAGESAGQCGPCVHGLAALSEEFDALAAGRPRPDTLSRLRRWSAMVDRRGGCSFPDGAVRFLRSALTTFAVDVEAHLRHGGCGRDTNPPVLRVPAPKAGWR